MGRKLKINNEFEKSAQVYFTEISKYKSLSIDEEAELWKRYKELGDIRARDKIVNSNLKFVASVARQFMGLGLSYSDLIAEGNMGLMKAMEKFDYTKGYKTISYSVWWIRQTILDALEKRNLMQAEELPKDYEKQVDSENESVYINKNETTECFDDSIAEVMKQSEDKSFVSLLFKELNDKEKSIIEKYFGLNGEKEMTLEEIGNYYGLTKERVRQIKCDAFTKMRSVALSFDENGTIY
jgi:RNA polymerase primary sigma factor